jgi:Flp pilus assembly protein TadD
MADPFAGRLLARAQQQLALHQIDGAIDTLKQLLGLQPENVHAHALLALSLHDRGRLHAARAEASAAIALAPDDPLALMAHGCVLVAERKFKAAEQAYALALAIWPDNAGLLLQVARLKESSGRRGEALQYLERARDSHPDDAQVWTALAQWFFRNGRPRDSETSAERALRIEPEHVHANVLMGYALLRSGRRREAREHAIAALRGNPRDRSALGLLVACKLRQNPLLGLWMRWMLWMTTRGASGQIRILIGLYLGSRALSYACTDLGYRQAADAVSWIWLVFVAYSWFAPLWFAQMLRRETRTVQLNAEY